MSSQLPMKRDDQDQHTSIENSNGSSPSGEELAQTDLEGQQMSELPEREAMSLVNANVAAPINAALALNVLSDGSVAEASATQNAPINQPIG